MITRPYARKRGTVYFGSGSRTASCPYAKGNKFILGSGRKRRRNLRKTIKKQKGFFGPLIAAAAPIAKDLLGKVFK